MKLIGRKVFNFPVITGWLCLMLLITDLAIGSQVTADDCQCDFDIGNCSSQEISDCKFDCNCLAGVCSPNA